MEDIITEACDAMRVMKADEQSKKTEMNKKKDRTMESDLRRERVYEILL